MNTINVDVVFGSDGSVDVAASNAAFNAALSKFTAETETQLVAIASAVASVFDKHKGQRIPMPAVCSLTVTELNGQPTNWNTLTERVSDYLRNNKAEYSIAKGKGGGVARTSDLPKSE